MGGLDLSGFTHKDLRARSLDAETCRKWDYRVGEYNGKPSQAAVYKDADGVVVAAKLRSKDKEFTIIGDAKKMTLYGQWLWPSGQRMITVTEGEIDAMSVSQAQSLKWPVVSVPNGAASALRAVKANYEYLVSFEKVVLWFDADEAGSKAAIQCAEALPAGKVFIVQSADLKDANEYVKAGRSSEIVNFLFRAKPYRPDGIVCGEDLWAKVAEENTAHTIEYPWNGMNRVLHGLRAGELLTVCAGTGVGKSTFIRELAYHLIKRGENVGLLCLEENTRRTALGLMGLALDKPLHITREGVDDKQLRAAFDQTVGRNGVYLYDHFGSVGVDNLLMRIQYLARGCDCRWIILDHLSIVVSGIDAGDDERRAIDRAMTLLRTLVEETGIGLIVVSHLKRTSNGSSHEEGAQVSLSHLRGSQAIAQMSDSVVALERDQQDEEQSSLIVVRVLKNRFSGENGVAMRMTYDRVTGRLTEVVDGFVPGEPPTHEY